MYIELYSLKHRVFEVKAKQIVWTWANVFNLCESTFLIGKMKIMSDSVYILSSLKTL